MTLISTFNKQVAVLNKIGNLVSHTNSRKASTTVKRGKAKWLDKDSIQLLYSPKDLKAFKKIVHERDGYQCFYCGLQLCKKDKLLTVDHVIPLRLGGSILPKNMVCSCYNCNAQKSYRTYEQYFLALYGLLLSRTLS